MWLPESEFRRKHAASHRSAEAKALKKSLFKRQKGLCARCKLPLPFWGGDLNLTAYEKMKKGERIRDDEAFLLHRKCHPKGTYTWQKLRADKRFDRDMAWIDWTCRMLWRLIKLPFKRRQPPRPRGGSRL